MNTTDWVNIKASKGVTINGGGTALVLSPEGATVYTDGKVQFHCASLAEAAPQAKPLDFQPFPTGKTNDAFPFSL